MGAQSEALLAKLCKRSFLSLWSYPNPYNDKGLAKRQEGKELCDLLVIFGDDVIIFSDKSCVYPQTGDARLDWTRWYKRAVKDSVLQIFGAERWLRDHPGRVFADNRCTVPLDVSIPPRGQMRVHRIVVALGSRERCREYFGGGSGSLPIRSTDIPSDDLSEVFQVGRDGRPGAFVHVFDDMALHVVLSELDTAADFVDYLTKKEACFATHDVFATGEEDLLAHFLLTMDGAEHAFVPARTLENDGDFDKTVLFVDETAFVGLVAKDEYAESKRANRPSYFWDNLIEHFTKYFRSGELVEGPTALEFELALRQMATPSRVVRRQLGKMLYSALNTADLGKARYMAVFDLAGGGLGYGVVCMSYDGDVSYEVYRERRRALMLLYAKSLRVRQDVLRQVLVLGIQPKHNLGSSEDMALIDLSDWSPELEAETREQMAAFGIGASASHFREQEFPSRARHLGGREAERRRKQLERKGKRDLN